MYITSYMIHRPIICIISETTVRTCQLQLLRLELYSLVCDWPYILSQCLAHTFFEVQLCRHFYRIDLVNSTGRDSCLDLVVPIHILSKRNNTCVISLPLVFITNKKPEDQWFCKCSPDYWSVADNTISTKFDLAVK